MDEKSLSDELSQLMSDTHAIEPGSSEEKTDEQKDILADSLKAVAGQSDEGLEAALDEFLSGKGVLHEATHSALTRGGTGLSDVIDLLIKQFKLSPAVAKMIASLILKMQSSAGQYSAAKKKPRRKSKPKTPASAKKAKKKAKSKAKKSASKTVAKKKPASSAKKPKKTASKTTAKKKATSKTKPRSAKKTISKTAAKKKTSTKTGKKKTTAKPKPKKVRRANSVEIP